MTELESFGEKDAGRLEDFLDTFAIDFVRLPIFIETEEFRMEFYKPEFAFRVSG